MFRHNYHGTYLWIRPTVTHGLLSLELSVDCQFNSNHVQPVETPTPTPNRQSNDLDNKYTVGQRSGQWPALCVTAILGTTGRPETL